MNLILTFINSKHSKCNININPIEIFMSLRQLVIGSGGIYASYLLSSVISEKLYSVPYPSRQNPQEAHKFAYPSLIVWFSSLMCALFGYIKGTVTNEVVNPIVIRQQIILGLLFTLNMLTANYALLYITYLEQALGRNSRYLMVVIVGAFFSRVKKGSSLKLPAKKVLVAFLITTGVLMFTALGQNHKHSKSHDESKHWIGYLMLAISITADALFSDSQAYSKVNYKPSSNHLFTSTSFYAFLFCFVFSLFSGEVVQQLYFCLDHPTVIFDIFVMSVLQVVGQISIYYVILNFKQHMFPLISTTRKVFTVFLSIIIFGHSLNGMQWLAISLVFIGLAYELLEEIGGKKHAQQKDNKELEKEKQPPTTAAVTAAVPAVPVPATSPEEKKQSRNSPQRKSKKFDSEAKKQK